MVRSIALAAALLVIAAAPASAVEGVLTQKAGTEGCVSLTGTGGDCQDGAGIDLGAETAISPDGKNVYVGSSDADSIAIFDRDPLTGQVRQKAGTAGCVSETGSGGDCADGIGLDQADGVVVSQDGKNVYVAGQSSYAVAVFDRDVDTGALTQKTGTDACVSETGSGGLCATGEARVGAVGLASSATGKNLYAVAAGSDSVVVFDRDATTGLLTEVSCASESGSGGACADVHGIAGALGLGMDDEGETLYVAGQLSNAIAVFDINADGSITQKAGTAGCVSEDGSGGQCADGTALVQPRGRISLSTDGRSVYVATQGSDSLVVFDRGLNTRPTCLPVTASVVHDVLIAVPLSCSDADGDAVTREIVGPPQHGSLGAPGATVQYTPSAGYTGPDAFSFRASDAGGAGSTVAVTITVTNVAPSCSALSASVPHGTSASLQLQCSDPDDAVLTVAVTGAPGHGAVGAVDQATRKVTYTAGQFVGADAFTFTATDATGATGSATASLTLTGTPPACTDLVSRPGSVLVQCIDVDGDPMTLRVVSGPAHGTLGPIANGEVIYTAASATPVRDEFTYAATALDGESVPATVTITATPLVVPVKAIATLPPAKACVSRRKFRIRLRNVKGNAVVRAQIKLNGKSARVVKGKALSLPIDLRGLPKGRVKVEIITTNRNGARLVGRRVYHTCVPKKRR
jgi:6-phosphogluconolactonase (cycloisomerase 2 family)